MEQTKRLYPYLITYSLLTGSLTPNIVTQVKEALKAKAPDKAVFKRGDGTWATLDSLHPDQRDIIENIVKNT